MLEREGDRLFSNLTHKRKIKCEAFPEFSSWTENNFFVTDYWGTNLVKHFIITVSAILLQLCVQI